MAGPSHSRRKSDIPEVYDGNHMSGGLCRELAGGLCKYVDETGSVCYDKGEINIHPIVLHYRDEDRYMKVLSFVGLSGIMAYSVPSTFAFFKSNDVRATPNYAVIKHHFVTDCPSYKNPNSSTCTLVGQAQLTRRPTPNDEVKRPFVIWCTTYQLS